VKHFVLLHRYVLLDYAVLLIIVAVCVPLLVVVPHSRPYGATLIAWGLAFTFHIWRWLPWERAHVQQTAHRRADCVMQARGVGKVHRQTKSLHTTMSSSLLTGPLGEGNYLPGCEGEAGEDSSSFEWCLNAPLPRELLEDTNDTSNSFPCLMPRIKREEVEEEEQKERGNGHVTTSPALTLQQREPFSSPALLPPPHISASAQESSSQFLALSASPTCPSLLPAKHVVAEEEEHQLYERRSHEPFTHVSHHRCMGSAADMSSLLPSLSAIEEADAAAASAVPLRSLSPASTCRTHGFVPLSGASAREEGTLVPSPFDDTEHATAVLSRASSPRPPSRISIISSNVRHQEDLALVPQGLLRDG
jgi:hypothetical protein